MPDHFVQVVNNASCLSPPPFISFGSTTVETSSSSDAKKQDTPTLQKKSYMGCDTWIQSTLMICMDITDCNENAHLKRLKMHDTTKFMNLNEEEPKCQSCFIQKIVNYDESWKLVKNLDDAPNMLWFFFFLLTWSLCIICSFCPSFRCSFPNNFLIDFCFVNDSSCWLVLICYVFA